MESSIQKSSLGTNVNPWHIHNPTCKCRLSIQLQTQAREALSSLDPGDLVERVIQGLVQATEPLSNKSLLPNDLGASARIVTDRCHYSP